jgi:hypothetical protein
VRRQDDPTDAYYGVLAKPFRLPDPFRAQREFDPRGPFLLTSRERARARRLADEATLERVVALFRYFNLDPGQWQELALALARRHVPGFAITMNAGNPVIETTVMLSRFYRYVNRARAKRRREIGGSLPSVRAASGWTAGRPDFIGLFPELAETKAARLGNLHSKAKAMRKAYLEWLWHGRGADPDSGYVRPGPPPWQPETGGAMFRRYADPKNLHDGPADA